MRSILLEAQNYEGMFTAYFAMLRQHLGEVTAAELGPDGSTWNETNIEAVKNLVENKIRWAKKVLKTSDRITWYLRQLRLTYCAVYDCTKPLAQRYSQQMGNQLAFRRLADFPNICSMSGIDYLTHSLDHFMSINSGLVQRVVFGNRPMEDVIADLQAAERSWQEKRKHTVQPDEDVTTVLDFGNGWAWYDLERAACDIEGGAMGHCGNSPRAGSDDTILSLRREVDVDGQIMHRPAATFILRSDGMLTEMKGRFNEKPGEDLHPMIVALLKLPIIKGIVGGGYLPKNNFTMADLDEEQRDELLEVKPELGDSYDYLERHGYDETFVDKLHTDLQAKLGQNGNIHDINRKYVTLVEFENVAAYWDAHYFNLTEWKMDLVRKMCDMDFSGLPLLSDYGDFVRDLWDDRVCGQLLRHDHETSDDIGDTNTGHHLYSFYNKLCATIAKRAENYLWVWVDHLPLSSGAWARRSRAGKIVVRADTEGLARDLHDFGTEDDYSSGGLDLQEVEENGWLAANDWSFEVAEGEWKKMPNGEDVCRRLHDKIMVMARRLLDRYVSGSDPLAKNQLSFDFGD